MASNPDLVQYIADQMARAGEITFKKMFGEYGLYCNEKISGYVEKTHPLMILVRIALSYYALGITFNTAS